MGLDLGRHDKGGDELVQCEGCGRWCYLEETGFGSLEVAAEVSFECRLCVKLQQVTGEWEGRVREIEAQLKAEGEKRVGLEAQVEELTWQLNHEREQRVGLEKQAEELGEQGGLEERKRECDSRVERLEGVIRASESSEGRKEEVSVLAGRTASLQAGVPGGRESGLLAGGLDDAGELIEPQLNGAFEQQASGSQVTGDKSQDKGAQAPGGSRVLVVGSSNVARVRRGVHNRVKGDQRVTVEVQPGKCMVDAMTAAREGVWDNREGRNLVIVHAGLNDVLKGRSQNLGKQLNVGIRKLRDVSENVHVVVCTIPEVRGQSGLTERRVVEANGVIKGMSRQLRYDVMEVNREVYEAGSRPFADGIHYSEATGYRVGDRMGRTVTAFLGGPRALGALKGSSVPKKAACKLPQQRHRTCSAASTRFNLVESFIRQLRTACTRREVMLLLACLVLLFACAGSPSFSNDWWQHARCLANCNPRFQRSCPRHWATGCVCMARQGYPGAGICVDPRHPLLLWRTSRVPW
ncbi:hypothetical protein ISCGN_010007 [Ixodes scapularis]